MAIECYGTPLPKNLSRCRINYAQAEALYSNAISLQKDFVYSTQRKQCSCKIIRDISNIPCNLSIF